MVPGEGPMPARGMIVGEAPGKTETEQGRPFVGPSGRLLDTALNAVGVPREYVYVTNIVKEMPLDDMGKIRRPTREEIEEWRVILEGEIQNAAPRAILALGKTASLALTGVDIPAGSRWAGELLVFTAWHPAYLLRNGKSNDIGEWVEQLRPWAVELGNE